MTLCSNHAAVPRITSSQDDEEDRSRVRQMKSRDVCSLTAFAVSRTFSRHPSLGLRDAIIILVLRTGFRRQEKYRVILW